MYICFVKANQSPNTIRNNHMKMCKMSYYAHR